MAIHQKDIPLFIKHITATVDNDLFPMLHIHHFIKAAANLTVEYNYQQVEIVELHFSL